MGIASADELIEDLRYRMGGGMSMDRAALLKQGISQGKDLSKLTVRALLLSQTFAFEAEQEIGFEITERVAEFFQVSVRAIHACGSAKLGFSPLKGTPFISAQSDLDLAIIDHDCFTTYLEAVIKETDQYRDLSGFPNSSYASFAKYIAKGIFVRISCNFAKLAVFGWSSLVLYLEITLRVS